MDEYDDYDEDFTPVWYAAMPDANSSPIILEAIQNIAKVRAHIKGSMAQEISASKATPLLPEHYPEFRRALSNRELFPVNSLLDEVAPWYQHVGMSQPPAQVSTSSPALDQAWGEVRGGEIVHGAIYTKGGVRQIARALGPVVAGDTTATVVHLPVAGPRYCSCAQRLMILDVSRKRLGALLGARLGLVECETSSAELEALLVELFAIYDDALEELGNDGYLVIKSTEGLFRGVAMRILGSEIPEFSGLDRAMTKMMERAKGARVGGRFRALVDRVVDLGDAQVALEMFGMMKLAGSPMVSEVETARSAKELGTTNQMFSAKAAKEVGYVLSAMILDGYVRSSGQWPPFTDPPVAGTQLGELYRSRILTIPVGSYPIEDWDGVHMGKLFSVDERIDTLETLDDKSCAAPSQFTGNVMKGRMGGYASESVLERALTTPTVPVRPMLEHIKSGTIPAADQACKLAIKGGEMKPVGRLFAMFTYELRQALSVCERALQANVQPLLDECLKAKSPGEITTILRKLSALGCPVLEADAARWNLHMDGFNTLPCAQVLDEIHGEDYLWTSLHNTFHQVTLYLTPAGGFTGVVTDAHSIGDTPTSWRNHQKGLEGQCQVFWELFTIAMIRWSLLRNGVRFIGYGQGDNHFGAVPDTRLEDVPAVMKMIDEGAALLGHEIKAEEFEVSVGALTCSKVWYRDGRVLIPQLKKFCSVFIPPSGETSCLSSRLSGPSATCAALTTDFVDPIRLLRASQVSTRVVCHLIGGTGRYPGSIRDLTKAVSLPNVLGGYPIADGSRFLWRGHSDPGSSSVAAIKVERTWSWGAVRMSEEEPEVDKRHLIEDPYSFPLQGRPQDPGTATASTVSAVLTGITTNYSYREVLNYGKQRKTIDRLGDLLVQGGVNPVVVSELAKASREGVGRKLFARFRGTETMKRIASRSGIDLTRITRGADEDLLAWVIGRADALRPGTPAEIPSVYHLVRKIRDAWGIPTLSGMTTANPLDDVVRVGSSEGIVVHPSTGRYRPDRNGYRGSRTAARLEHGVQRAVMNSSTAKDLRLLVTLESQIRPPARSGIAGAFEEIIDSRAAQGATVVRPFFPRAAGGTLSHRIDLHDRIGFAPASSTLMTAHLTVTSDHLGLDPIVDVPFAVQEHMSYAVTAYAILASLTGESRPREYVFPIGDLVPIHDAVPIGTTWNREEPAPVRNPILSLDYVKTNDPKGLDLSGLAIKLPLGKRVVNVLVARILSVLGSDGRLGKVISHLDVLYASEMVDRSEVIALGARTCVEGMVEATMLLAFAFVLVAERTQLGKVEVRNAMTSVARAVVTLVGPAILACDDAHTVLVGTEMYQFGGNIGAELEGVAQVVVSHAMSVMSLQPKYPPAKIPLVPIFEGKINATAYKRLIVGSGILYDFRSLKMSMSRGASLLREAVRNDKVYSYGGLAEVSLRISRGRGGVVINVGELESLRHIRRAKSEPVNIVRLPTVKTKPEVCHATAGGGMLVRYLPAKCCDPTPIERVDNTFYRAATVLGGMGASSGVEALEAIPPGTGPALCVGFGQGGSASALIQQGYVVYGIDLLEAIPDTQRLTSDWAPPEVVARGMASHFFVSSKTHIGGGDWQECGRHAILRTVPRMIYLGIERGDEPSPLGDLEPLITTRYMGDLVVRVVGCEHTVAAHVSVLRRSSNNVRVHRPAAFRTSGAVHITATISSPIVNLLVETRLPVVTIVERLTDFSWGVPSSLLKKRMIHQLFPTTITFVDESILGAVEEARKMVNGATANDRSFLVMSDITKMRSGLEAYRIAMKRLNDGEWINEWASPEGKSAVKLLGSLSALSRSLGVPWKYALCWRPSDKGVDPPAVSGREQAIHTELGEVDSGDDSGDGSGYVTAPDGGGVTPKDASEEEDDTPGWQQWILRRSLQGRTGKRVKRTKIGRRARDDPPPE